MVRIYDIPDGFDAAAQLPGILARLPQWRLEKAVSYRRDIDRFLCAKSFLMLEDILREHFGTDRCPVFSYGIHGKPYFREHPEISFNISHCRRGIACAVSDSPVGIDIEEIQYDEKFVSIRLNPGELATVRNSNEPDVEFTRLWTLKESFLKLTGGGIRDNLKDILLETEGVRFKTHANRSAGYVCSMAVYDKHTPAGTSTCSSQR